MPGTGPILHEDKATDWLGNVGYNQEALLSHVMAMVAHNGSLAYGAKSFSYDTVGTVQISSIVDVSMVAVQQKSGTPTRDVEFMNTEVFMKLGMSDSSWPGSTIGYGWTGTLEDMGRVGVMLVHDGWYGGERFMEASWVYRMSHPSHEDANTAYGQLAWLNNRGGGTSFGAAIDQCAPAAFWPKYPHVGSEAPDCGAQDGNCVQEHDVGVFSAQGLGGQFIVMHPGLDLVITAHNASEPASLWAAIRPAVVAMDPEYTGDDAAFCEAYGAGKYAPDLLAPRVAPTM
jgi:CubicO group peptidase (beta-lactamase class C family)